MSAQPASPAKQPPSLWARILDSDILASFLRSKVTMVAAVIVLVAALPSASNVSMLAERFGADNGRIARIILWTTVAAFVTFPLAVRWLT